MKLAKPRVDIGLATHALELMLSFWRNEAGVPFDHLLKIRRGHDQYRHDANGSVLKINHHADPLPKTPASGYRQLVIARPGVTTPRDLRDPDGNSLRLVPPGFGGVDQIGIRLAVRDLARHRRFYAEALGLPEAETDGETAFRAGESLICGSAWKKDPVSGVIGA